MINYLKIGFKKAFNTYTMQKAIDDKAIEIFHKFGIYSSKRLNIHYDTIQFKNIDNDLKDIQPSN